MIKDLLKQNLSLRKWVRYNRLKKLQPDWNTIISTHRTLWTESINYPKDQKILIATNVGAFLTGTVTESLLAVSLTLRQQEVHFLLCDGILPACLDCMLGITISEKELAFRGPQPDLCHSCFTYAYRMMQSLGLKVHRFSEYLTAAELNQIDEMIKTTKLSQIPDFTFNGWKVGEHTLAGTLRFYAKGVLGDDPYTQQILLRYFKAALISVNVINNLLTRYPFDVAVFHHGIYVPQGLIGEVCRAKGIRVVNWNPTYKKQTFIFSHQDTYHHTLMAEPTKKWEDLSWDEVQENKITDYLNSRWSGTKDWIWFHDKNPDFDVTRFARRVGLDLNQPCIGMLTNVIWDAQLHYPANIFNNMVDWLVQTINYFIQKPALQLIVRIHPAEVRGTIPSRQPVVKELKKQFTQLPPNIFIIPPENPLSTYPIMERCNAVIIYGTKTGVELTARGIPVIVAGEAWIRNKGLTYDPNTPKEYFQILNQLPFSAKMSREQVTRAYKYAYHFFFRRMIPLKFIESELSLFKGIAYKIYLNDITDLLPEKYHPLDVICNGIIRGGDFIYPAEKELI